MQVSTSTSEGSLPPSSGGSHGLGQQVLPVLGPGRGKPGSPHALLHLVVQGGVRLHQAGFPQTHALHNAC